MDILSGKRKKKINADRLTPRQENFAYLVGYEKYTYSSAYRKAYSSDKMKEQSIWTNASSTAKIAKVSNRIDYFREQRLKEERRKFKWTISEAESELRTVLEKNKQDLIRAEENGESAKHATNDAIIRAVDALNAMSKRIEDDENELALRKAKADAETAEIKNRLLKEKIGDEGEKIIFDINL